MSHATVILHEKQMHEHIADWEHEVVHEEMQTIGFSRTASQDGVVQHLPRACYFNQAGSNLDIARVQKNLKSHLGREVSIEVTIGTSHGYGLKPVLRHPVSSFAPLLSSPSMVPRLNSAIASPGDSWERGLYSPLNGIGGYLK
jgi:hypothetical protein